MGVQIIPDSEEFENRFDAKLENFRESILSDLKKQLDIRKPEEYLTREDVAEILKVSVATVDIWTKKGKLKSYRVYGRKAIYKRSEVEASLTPVN